MATMRFGMHSVLVAAFLGACASAGHAPTTREVAFAPPGTIYDLTGVVNGDPVDVRFVFEKERLVVGGPKTCGIPVDDANAIMNVGGQLVRPARATSATVRQGPDDLRLVCSSMRVRLSRDAAAGVIATATVKQFETRQERGECLSWYIDPKTREKKYCINYQMVEKRVERGWSPVTPVVVTESTAAEESSPAK
jgi:hypothetical protein